MGVEPTQGHSFTRDDWKHVTPNQLQLVSGQVALVSENFWMRHFGNQPFQSGKKLKTWNLTLEIIGILPTGFHFPDSVSADVWAPIAVVDSSERSAHNYHVVARLKRGVSVEQAQVQSTAIADRLAKAYPGSNKLIGIRVTPLRDYNVRQVKTSLYMLLGAVLLVLAHRLRERG